MAVPNSHRGEVAITLGGRALAMRPTFEAIAGIETETGQGLARLAARIGEGDIVLKDLVAIVRHGLHGHEGYWRTPEKVGAMVLEAGAFACAAPALALLGNALTGGRAAKEGPPPNPPTPATDASPSAGS